MNEQIQNIRVKFKCTANWDEMTPMAGGRFCDSCAKVVYDFTDAKHAEFQKILAENKGGVCGRFRAEQMAPEPVLLPKWKQWLSAAMLLIGINLFTQCKENVKGKVTPQENELSANAYMTGAPLLVPNKVARVNAKVRQKTIKQITKFSEPVAMGIVEDVKFLDSVPVFYDPVETLPEFPGGQEKMLAFVSKNIHWPKAALEWTGKVQVSFDVEPDGNLSNIKLIRPTDNKPLEDEIIRVMKLMPKWKPGTSDGQAVKTPQVLPITFETNNY